LAAFFTTASGQRALRALSVLTVIALSFGSPPLAIARAVVAAFGGLERPFGIKVEAFDRATEALLKLLDDVQSREVRAYVDAIGQDQGAMVQLMPEAMDLYIAGVEDRPGVVYQSTASMAPPPSVRGFAPLLLQPWSAASGGVFAALHTIASRLDRRYPCAAPDAGATNEALLARAFGRVPGARANDGVVPIRSQIWGRLIWAGHADHLDVLGHFRDDDPSRSLDGHPPHVDWLYSASNFGRSQFGALLDAVAEGMLMKT
jgi:hypothetical protein